MAFAGQAHRRKPVLRRAAHEWNMSDASEGEDSEPTYDSDLDRAEASSDFSLLSPSTWSARQLALAGVASTALASTAIVHRAAIASAAKGYWASVVGSGEEPGEPFGPDNLDPGASRVTRVHVDQSVVGAELQRQLALSKLNRSHDASVQAQASVGIIDQQFMTFEVFYKEIVLGADFTERYRTMMGLTFLHKIPAFAEKLRLTGTSVVRLVGASSFLGKRVIGYLAQIDKDLQVATQRINQHAPDLVVESKEEPDLGNVNLDPGSAFIYGSSAQVKEFLSSMRQHQDERVQGELPPPETLEEKRSLLDREITLQTEKAKSVVRGGKVADSSAHLAAASDIASFKRLLTLYDFVREFAFAERDTPAMAAIDARGARFVTFCGSILTLARTRSDLWDDLTKRLLTFWARSQVRSEDRISIILFGAPGSGKSYMAKRISKFLVLGGVLAGLDRDLPTFMSGDFRGKYVGESETKTKQILSSHYETPLFVDEAQGLGMDPKTGGDSSLPRRTLSLMMTFITENPRAVSLIFAGYEKDIREQVFALDPGIERRFLVYRVENFTPNAMMALLFRHIHSRGLAGGVHSIRTELFEVLHAIFGIAALFRYSAASTLTFADHLETALVDESAKVESVTQGKIEAITHRVLWRALRSHARALQIELDDATPETLVRHNDRFHGPASERASFADRQRLETTSVRELIRRIDRAFKTDLPPWKDLWAYTSGASSFLAAVTGSPIRSSRGHGLTVKCDPTACFDATVDTVELLVPGRTIGVLFGVDNALVRATVEEVRFEDLMTVAGAQRSVYIALRDVVSVNFDEPEPRPRPLPARVVATPDSNAEEEEEMLEAWAKVRTSEDPEPMTFLVFNVMCESKAKECLSVLVQQEPVDVRNYVSVVSRVSLVNLIIDGKMAM